MWVLFLNVFSFCFIINVSLKACPAPTYFRHATVQPLKPSTLLSSLNIKSDMKCWPSKNTEQGRRRLRCIVHKCVNCYTPSGFMWPSDAQEHMQLLSYGNLSMKLYARSLTSSNKAQSLGCSGANHAVEHGRLVICSNESRL